MKRTIKLTLFLLFIFNINSYSQDSRFSGFLNLNSAHFTNNGENIQYSLPTDIGIESGVWFDLTKNVSIGTGLSFQMGRISSYDNKSGTEFWELSTPFLAKFSTSGKNKLKFFTIAGIYLGNISYYKDSSYVRKTYDLAYWKIREDLVFPDIRADLLICPGIEYQVSKNFGISISPFIKYSFIRLTNGPYIDPFYYGLKVGARFSVKEKENLLRGNFLSKTHLIVRSGISHFSFPGSSLIKIDTSSYYSFPLDPCIEINFAYDFDRISSIGTGICFQSARVVDHDKYFIFNQVNDPLSVISEYKRLFVFREVSIPLYYSLNIYSKNKLYSFLSAGMSFGLKTYWKEFRSTYNDQGQMYLYHVSQRNFLSGELPLWKSETYSLNIKFIDLFLEYGVKYAISNNLLLQASPSLKFRIKDQFFEDTNSFSIGFKAGVQFCFD